MRITRIVVNGLFDRFDHDLIFKDEQIAIMIGPNGFGKTWILRILNAILSRALNTLLPMPFRQVLLYFDDDSLLTVTRGKPEGGTNRGNGLTLMLRGGHAGKGGALTLEVPAQQPHVGFSLDAVEHVVPELSRIGEAQWQIRTTGETLDLDDVFVRYEDFLPGVPLHAQLPEWLQSIRQAIPVRLIDTERLTSRRNTQRTARRRAAAAPARTVSKYSEELGELVSQKLAEYATLSQSLDRTFPTRLVEAETPWTGEPLDQLQRRLEAIEIKRSRLVEAGLLVQEREDWKLPPLTRLDESRAVVLGVYASDAEKKLAVFDDLLARVDTFRRIANSRLLYKRVHVSRDGFKVVTTPDSSELRLEMLSSGEQHELLFLFEFLFRIRDNSLILFDEPELSLHAAWQEQFLSDLEEIAKLSKFVVLMATHSPLIIGDRWDLTIQLKGPDTKE